MSSHRKESELGSRLREWLKTHPSFRTIKQVAEAAGLTYSATKDYFGGRAAPGPEALKKLVSLTGQTPLAPPGESEGPLFKKPGDAAPLAHDSSRSPKDAAGSPAPVTEATSILEDIPKNLLELPMTTAAPYHAYMATALTGLERAAKIGVIFISDCVANICKQNGIDLYEPRKSTDPVNNATIQDHTVYLLDREKVTMSDLVIVLCEFPSFGAGQEIEIAGNAAVPLILLAMSDKKPSRMVTGTPVYKVKVEFSDPDDLCKELDRALKEIKPHLEERRKKLEAMPIPRELGKRVKTLRKQRQLDPAELAKEIGVTEQFIKNLEEASTPITNLSLIHLSSLAYALEVPFYQLFGEVADTGEPIPKVAVLWARKKGLSREKLLKVLTFRVAARGEDPAKVRELDEKRLNEMLADLEKYEREIPRPPEA